MSKFIFLILFRDLLLQQDIGTYRYTYKCNEDLDNIVY
jgi:hypothetical protein